MNITEQPIKKKLLPKRQVKERFCFLVSLFLTFTFFLDANVKIYTNFLSSYYHGKPHIT